MTDLSPEARELIARARPAERSDPSAKRRVRAALAVHLAPLPTVPPSTGTAATGSAGVAASAGKLVLICSLAAVGGAGTVALVRSRIAAERSRTIGATAHVAPRPNQALATPVLENSEAKPAPVPANGAREIPRAALAVPGEGRTEPVGDQRATSEWRRGDLHHGQLAARDQGPPRKVGLPASGERTAELAESPALAGSPERATETARSPASSSASGTEPGFADLPSSWRNSDLPRPIPDGRVTRVTSTSSPSKTCSAASELKLLSAAQAALREGDGHRALGLLDQHARGCPSATFGEEQSAARVLALCLLHREEQAFVEAARLSARSPRSPLLARLRSSCAASALASPTKP
jgi:hypothetical protein